MLCLCEVSFPIVIYFTVSATENHLVGNEGEGEEGQGIIS